MKRNVTSKLLLSLAASAGLVLFAGCTEFDYSGRPYDSGYGGGYNGGYNDSYHDRNDRRYDHERERREHDRERDRERERREDERRRRDSERREYSPPPRVAEPQCPSGTHPSTHRCTKEERKRGCKDIGLGNGRGCSNF